MLPVDIYPCCRITILASLLLQYFRSHSTLACLSMRSVGYRSGLVRLVGKARLLQTTIWLWWRSQTWVILLTLPNVTSSLHIGHALTIAIQVYKIQWFDEIVWLGRPPSRCLDLILFQHSPSLKSDCSRAVARLVMNQGENASWRLFRAGRMSMYPQDALHHAILQLC